MSIEEDEMDKTKEQLYEELKELTEESRKQVKELLDGMVESGVLSTYTINIPRFLHFSNHYDIEPEKLADKLDAYVELVVSEFEDYCNYRDISIQTADIENPDFYESLVIAFCPQTDATLLGDLFYFVNFSYQETLREFVENYVEYGNAFTEYLCDNGFISADIYSENFYDLITIKGLQGIFDECKEFFKYELVKLKKLQTKLCECESKLKELDSTFEHRFGEYLENLGYGYYG